MATMTRKHYKEFADIIRENGGDNWYILASKFATVLQEDNPRFRRDKFYNACNPNKAKV